MLRLIVIRNHSLEKQGNDMKMIKGVVFDFSGTLFWDTACHNRAWDLGKVDRGDVWVGLGE